MALCALFAALITVCAWLSIPTGDISFTLQTFGIALTLLLLGGKWGTGAIFVYLLLGIVGLPVFSGFQGGIGALLGVTGGYITGFLLWGIVYWVVTSLHQRLHILGLVLGLIGCYCFGTLWYTSLYLEGGLGLVLLKCVVPFLLPDAIKLSLAIFLARRLKRFVY